jgi:methylmalonic aciduria homocystinuria type C protein
MRRRAAAVNAMVRRDRPCHGATVVVAPVSTSLATAGLDLVHAFDARAVATLPGLAGLGTGRGLLVGNTRALWPRFVAAYRADPTLRAAAEPLDAYVERAVRAAASPTARLRFGHLPDAAGAYLPLQRMAAAIGLGALSPTHLVIHPSFGPWIALRAVILDDAEVGPPIVAAAPPCACGDPCRRAFEVARQATGDDAWRAWLAVRDACPIGRAARYGEAQLRYHYTKDRSILDAPTRADG